MGNYIIITDIHLSTHTGLFSTIVRTEVVCCGRSNHLPFFFRCSQEKLFREAVRATGAALETAFSDTQRKVSCRHCQLIIVGEPNAGKTSLQRALSGQEFKDDLPSTEGIEVTVGTTRLVGESDDRRPLLEVIQEDAIRTQAIASQVTVHSPESRQQQSPTKLIGPQLRQQHSMYTT